MNRLIFPNKAWIMFCLYMWRSLHSNSSKILLKIHCTLKSDNFLFKASYIPLMLLAHLRWRLKWALSLICRRRCCYSLCFKFFTFLSSSTEPLGQFQSNFVQIFIPPANEVAGVYSDPYVRPFVRPSVRPSLPISNQLLL